MGKPAVDERLPGNGQHGDNVCGVPLRCPGQGASLFELCGPYERGRSLGLFFDY